jgi:hypothetical protein
MPIASNEATSVRPFLYQQQTIQRGKFIAGVKLDPFKPQKISNFQATT